MYLWILALVPHLRLIEQNPDTSLHTLLGHCTSHSRHSNKHTRFKCFFPYLSTSQKLWITHSSLKLESVD